MATGAPEAACRRSIRSSACRDGCGVTPPIRWLLMASHVPPHGRGGGIVRYTVELARALQRRGDVELHLAASGSPLWAGGEGEEPPHLVLLPAAPSAVMPVVERYLLGRRLNSGFDVIQGAKHLVPRAVRGRTALTV